MIPAREPASDDLASARLAYAHRDLRRQRDGNACRDDGTGGAGHEDEDDHSGETPQTGVISETIGS